MSSNRSAPAIPGIIVAVGVVAACYAWAVIVLTPTHPGSIGLNLNALGTDFMVFHTGARWFFGGRLDALFDGTGFTEYLNAAFAGWLSQPIAFRPWVYPPSYLLLMLPLGALPFVTAYASFQLLTAAVLAIALWHVSRREVRVPVMAVALLGPAAAINAGMGQNAFLTSALIVAGFGLRPTRPLVGGAILGLLTAKPQFWPLVPIALIAMRDWRALTAAIAAAVMLAGVSAAVFGLGAWQHWLELARASYADPNGEWMELGRLWGGSVYACLATAGAPPALASAGQAAASITGAATVFLTFRAALPPNSRIAIVLAATVLTAPHTSLSDTALLGTAAALWAGELAKAGVPLAHWTLALAVWIAALVNPPVLSPVGRLTPLLLLAFVAVVLTGARRLPAFSSGVAPTWRRAASED